MRKKEDPVTPVKKKTEKVSSSAKSDLQIREPFTFHESEERYRILAEAAHDLIFIVNCEGILEYVNDYAARQHGRKPQNLVGKPLHELLPTEINTQNGIDLEKVFATGEPVYSEERIVLKKRTRWLGTWLVPLRGGTNRTTSIMGVARDITAQKQVEDDLRKRNEEMAAFQATVLDLAGQQDLNSLLLAIVKRSRILLHAPSGFMYLYQAETNDLELVVELGFPVKPGVRLKMGEGMAGQVAETRQPMILDNYSNWKGRSPVYSSTPYRAVVEVPMLFGGQLIGVLGVNDSVEKVCKFTKEDASLLLLFAGQAASLVHDARLVAGLQAELTVRNNVEQSLRAEQARYQALVEQIPAIIYTDSADRAGQTHYISPQITSILGYDPDEWSKNNDLWINAINAEDRQSVLVEYNRTFTSGEPFTAEYRLTSRDGKTIWIQDKAVLVRDQSGNPMFWQGIMLDISDRKQAELALKESEERYRRLFDISPDAITVHSGGRIILLNQAAMDLIGAKIPEEVIGKPMIDFVHPDSRNLVIERTRQQLVEGMAVPAVEEKFIRLDGTPFDVEVLAAPITYRDAKASLVIFRDISHRKAAETALQESEDKYRNVVERANDGITVLQDGIVRYVNPALAQMGGWMVDDLIGRPLTDFIYPEMIPELVDRYNRRMAGEDIPSSYETILRKKDNGKVYAELNAGVIPFQGSLADLVIVRDITERKLAEDALTASEVSYTGLFNSVTEAIYVQDRDGVFLNVNDGAVKMYGYPRDYFIGKSPADISAPGRNDLASIKKLVNKAFKGIPQQFEFWGMRSNGEIFPKEVRVSKGTYFGQDVVIAIAQDITQRKQAEAALQRQLEEITVLHSVSMTAAQADSVDQLIEQITRIIGERIYVDDFGIALLKEDKQVLIPHPSYHGESFGAFAEIPLTEGIMGYVASTGKPCNVSDVHKNTHYLNTVPETQSELCVPIKVGKKLIGVINAESHIVNFFNNDDERLLTTIAGTLATAIEKLHLFEAEHNRRQEADTLRQAAAAVSSSLELHQVLDTILISLNQVVPYDSASVILKDGDKLRLMAVQGFPNPEGIINKTLPGMDGLFGESQKMNGPIILADAQTDPRFQRWAGTDYTRGWMGVPLIVRDIVIGYITVDNRKPAIYDNESAALAQAFAYQAATAIENARLYEDAITAATRRSILHRASQELAQASQDPEKVYQAVHRAAAQLMPAEAFVITLLDDLRQETIGVYLVDKGGRSQQDRAPASAGLTGLVISTGKPVITNDLAVDPIPGSLHFGGEDEVRSVLAVPLRFGNQVTGMLSVQSYQPYAYSSDDQSLLEMLAANAAVAIENARLYAEAVQRLKELEAVNHISTTLRTARTVSEMLPNLLNETLQVLGIDSGMIWLFDQASGLLKPGAVHGWFSGIQETPLKPGEGIAGKVFETGQVLVSHEFATDPLTRESTRGQLLAGWGGACVPIRTVQETVGVMFVSVQLPREIQPGEVHLLVTLSEMAGNAIRRADLHGQTERQLQRLASLRAVDMAINTILDLRVTLGILIDHINSQLKVDAVNILLINPKTQTLYHAASSGFHSDAIKDMQMYIGDSLAGQAIRTRATVYIPDLNQSKFLPRVQILTGEGFVTYFGVPLIAKGQVKGILETFHRSLQEPDSEWRNFLETLAGQAAIAIDNSVLFEELQQTNLNLSLAYDATIEGWSKALDMRDQETEGHTLRVTQVTLQLADQMGINTTDLVHIRRGALLHDIGKMGVPDSILHKPGPLTDEEWDIMHRHPELAAEMLSTISYLRQALDIPYAHHERWDGSGYPRHLVGEQIPLAARIFAVVDVWDALISDRPYRKAWTRAAAVEYIRTNSGVQFDPRVVEAFLSIITN
jgi:PAS domain S-box-containing protein/putative nucleotidyltransferase with HDIG domain